MLDNGSRDGRRAVIADFAGTFEVRYFYDASLGLHVCRNHGFRGEILVFVADDVEAVPTLLSSVKERFENRKVALVGGKCLPKYEGQVPEWLDPMSAPNSRGDRMIGFLSLIDLGNLPKNDVVLTIAYQPQSSGAGACQEACICLANLAMSI